MSLDYTVCVPSAHLFRFPDGGSEHIDEALYGTRLDITDRLGGFVRITDQYGYDGWTAEQNVAPLLSPPSHIVTLPFADLLDEPANCHAPVMTLPRGARVDVGFSDQFDRHAFVVLPDKRIFYINKAAVAPLPKEADEQTTRRRIVENAASYLGVQYRWGGKTPAGIDCSGLAFMACALAGVTIWRDAVFEKTPRLREIKPDEAAMGDLYFFKGHIAVAVGGGDFIHASASAGMVCRGSLVEGGEGYSEWFGKNLVKTGSLF